MGLPFLDRKDAGRRLAPAVAALRLRDPLVLALPRGGVPVAAEVARALGAPLDLLLVRKIGAPVQRELAVGALAALATAPAGAAPARVCDEHLLALTGTSRAEFEREAAAQTGELERRRALYLQGRRHEPVAGRAVVVVDDGLATGTTARAGLLALRQMQPARLVLAVPVAPSDTVAKLRELVDDLVCLEQPEPFHAVGLHYRNFRQTEDDEVIEILDAFARARAAHDADGSH